MLSTTAKLSNQYKYKTFTTNAFFANHHVAACTQLVSLSAIESWANRGSRPGSYMSLHDAVKRAPIH
jgi:hypothetical protein